MADGTTAGDATAPQSSGAPLPQLVLELRDMVVTYVKQQTIVPLRQLGRYAGFGIGGAVLLGLGVVLLGVGGLRALQTETGDTFTGDWSWAPYLIVFAALLLGGAIVWRTRRVGARAEGEAMSQVNATRPVTRDDIEAKLREIQGGADAGADAARGAGLAAGLAVVLLAIVVAYLLGRRKGKKRRTYVEIRRV